LRLVEKLARRRGKDTRSTVSDFMRGHRKLEQLRAVWDSPLRDKAKFVLRNGKKIVRGRANNPASEQADPLPQSAQSERSEWLLAAFEWIATAHVPKPYKQPVSLFLTEDQERATPFLVRKWRKAAENLTVQYVPGDHLTCITKFVHALGAKFRLELERLNSVFSVLWGFSFLV